MSKVNSILNERIKKQAPSKKMKVMATESANGMRTTFSGIFAISELGVKDKQRIKNILINYAANKSDIDVDFDDLTMIASEVKAINHQAILLHGERIKKAQTILKKYRDGAFTAWLIAVYSNRQTPYNFLQYYEFYTQMPKALHKKIETMPKQAIYTLASREGQHDKKKQIIENYNGQTKQELLLLIRELFPLGSQDRRRQNIVENAINLLSRVCLSLSSKNLSITAKQKAKLTDLLEYIQTLIDK